MPPSTYWFPAKHHGWGWGLPSSWQGWVVLLVFASCLAANVYAFPPRQEPLRFTGCAVVLVALLIGVCWLKGEPPRWRWGQ